MTRPEYGKPETWPRQTPGPTDQIITYRVERHGPFNWHVIQHTTYIPGGGGTLNVSAAGPYWRHTRAIRECQHLTARQATLDQMTGGARPPAPADDRGHPR